MKKLIERYRARHPKHKLLDLAQIAIVVLFVAALGAYKINTSHAAASFQAVGGRVTDQKGRGIGGVGIFECQNNKTFTTDSSGNFLMPVVTNAAGDGQPVPLFCLRVTSYPANYNNGKAINEPNGSATYEWQVAALNCYHNYIYCGPDKPYRVDAHVLDWDVSLNNDSNYNFRVTYNDTVPPSKPTISGSVLSTSQIKLSWGASSDNYSGIANYDIYRKGAYLTTTSGTSYTDSGLAAGTTYSYYVKSKDGKGIFSAASNTVSLKTKLSPSSPSGGGSSSGGSTSIPKPTTDKTPPAAPQNFMASTNNDNKSVVLDWSSANDNVDVTGYSVDQSTDNKNWTNIANNISDDTYEDYSATFSQTNYYRVVAFDAAGNKSKYAYASVESPDFEPNVSKNKDAVITSDDSIVEVSIPAGSLEQDLFCTWVTPSNILGATVSHYRQVAGPYQLLCRNSLSDVINPLNSTTTASIHTDIINNGHKIKLAYFGQEDSGKWQQLTTKSDKKSKTDSVDLAGHNLFAVMTPVKQASIWGTILVILMIVLGIIFAVIMFLRFKLIRQLQNKYDDYLHQSRGF